MKEQKKRQSIYNVPSNKIIKTEIYFFLYVLLESIFLKNKKPNSYPKKFDQYISFINTNLIKDEKKHINTNFSFENMNNIVNFVKKQNLLYAGDIIEGLLILVFSQIFYVPKGKATGKFCESFSKIQKKQEKGVNKDNITNWINFDLLNINKNKLQEFFSEVKYPENKQEGNSISILQNVLKYIYKQKFKFINSRRMCRITPQKNPEINEISFSLSSTQASSQTNELNDNNSVDKSWTNIFNSKQFLYDEDFKDNYILLTKYFFVDDPKSEDMDPDHILIIRSFFETVYNYFQAKNSYLMKFTPSNKIEENKINEEDENYEEYDNKEAKKLVDVPFQYDISTSSLEGRYAFVLLSPVRLDSRIEKLVLQQNNFRENGMFEFGKILVFNKNLKSANFHTNIIKQSYLEYMNQAMSIFKNFNIEELNFVLNFLKEDSEEILCDMIEHLPKLKILNLTANELKRGVAFLFVKLKELYKEGKTELETIILNKCLLDETSFYELSQLIKCKFCKLKRIYLNINMMDKNSQFLKNLKKNPNLRKIFINRSNINDDDTTDIMRAINFSNLSDIYLYKNKFKNFDNLLRIFSRTKLITTDNEIYQKHSILFNKNKDINIDKEKDNVIINIEPTLLNMDLSSNEVINKNESHVKILEDLCDKTIISCIDISHILYGINPGRYNKSAKNEEFRKCVDATTKNLKEYKKNCKSLYKDLNKKLSENNYYNYVLNSNEYENIPAKEKNTNINDDIIDSISEIGPYDIVIQQEIEKMDVFQNNKTDKIFENYLFNKIKKKLNDREIKKLEDKKQKTKLLII